MRVSCCPRLCRSRCTETWGNNSATTVVVEGARASLVPTASSPPSSERPLVCCHWPYSRPRPHAGRPIGLRWTWKSAAFTSGRGSCPTCCRFLVCFSFASVVRGDRGRVPSSWCASVSRLLRRRSGWVIQKASFVMNAAAYGATPAPSMQTDIDSRAAMSSKIQTSTQLPSSLPSRYRPWPGAASAQSRVALQCHQVPRAARNWLAHPRGPTQGRLLRAASTQSASGSSPSGRCRQRSGRRRRRRPRPTAWNR